MKVLEKISNRGLLVLNVLAVGNLVAVLLLYLIGVAEIGDLIVTVIMTITMYALYYFLDYVFTLLRMYVKRYEVENIFSRYARVSRVIYIGMLVLAGLFMLGRGLIGGIDLVLELEFVNLDMMVSDVINEVIFGLVFILYGARAWFGQSHTEKMAMRMMKKWYNFGCWKTEE